MADFIVRFLLCNIFISGIIGILLLSKKLFQKHLTQRMQYNLWFLLLFLLGIPFLPFHSISYGMNFSLPSVFEKFSFSKAGNTMSHAAESASPVVVDWINDFALSVRAETPSTLARILFFIWIAGILAMTVLLVKSMLRFHALKKSALPLQHKKVQKLYQKCVAELNITQNIPIYSTAFLKSPVMAGLRKPCIYLPIHLISDLNIKDMRYMLLHELLHYKYKDALPNYLMNLAAVFYWFNPFVWFAFREMRSDREVACDTSVLTILKDDSYMEYGNTLINLVEKISLTPFPFAAGLSGNKTQITRRILNIASFHGETKSHSGKSICSCILIACILLGFVPLLSVNAEVENNYQMKDNQGSVSHTDLSSYFDGYEGCFVLFDSTRENFYIYNEGAAKKRISPNSTYKVYSALLGLEKGYITPESTDMKWNGDKNPFEQWNSDQNLASALGNSVNWYFQSLDEKTGMEALTDFYTRIQYGNHNLSSGVSRFWAESSLKISPVEQVALLEKLFKNDLNFNKDNVEAVKNALLLSSNSSGSLYGKTGTGNINGKDVNGWFIGFVETGDTSYYFAANLQKDSGANGSAASEITLEILHDWGIFP